MATMKTKSAGRSASRGGLRAPRATLTAAFVANRLLVLPEGTAAFTFQTPRHAVDAFSSRSPKVKSLLKTYGEAVERSLVTGRAVGFRVEVDPSGNTSVTALEEAADMGTAALPDETEALQMALEDARGRGRLRAAEILAGQDMLSADRFAGLLGTTRMTVNTKRQNHQVLGLEGAKRGFRFPAWQVGEDGKIFAALPQLFKRLGGGPWSVYRFLVQAHPELDGLSGREALHRGKAEQALAVADGIAEDTFA